MKMSFFVTPIRRVYEREGEGANGPWKSIDWLFGVPNSTDQIVGSTFAGNNDTLLEKAVGQNISVDFELTCNEWKDKFYNNIKISYVHFEVPQDVPGATATTPTGVTNAPTSTGNPVMTQQSGQQAVVDDNPDNDLPF